MDTITIPITTLYTNERSNALVLQRGIKYVTQCLISFYDKERRALQHESVIWTPDMIFNGDAARSVLVRDDVGRELLVGYAIPPDLRSVLLHACAQNRLDNILEQAEEIGAAVNASNSSGQLELKTRVINKTLLEYIKNGQPESPSKNEMYLVVTDDSAYDSAFRTRWVEHLRERVKEIGELAITEFPR